MQTLWLYALLSLEQIFPRQERRDLWNLAVAEALGSVIQSPVGRVPSASLPLPDVPPPEGHHASPSCTQDNTIPTPSPERAPEPSRRQTRLMSSGGQRRVITIHDTIEIPSRRGPVSITGRAAITFHECNSLLYGVPASIPVGEIVEVWGRRWIVRESSIPGSGMGVFAMDRIEVPEGTTFAHYPQLFPYVGAVYKYAQYRVMRRGVPFFKEYILESGKVMNLPPHRRRYIDGDPTRSGNIAGYIQSSVGNPRDIESRPNAEWHYVDGGHPWFQPRWNKDFHIMTVATTTIESGDEIFISYGYDRKIPPLLQS